MNHARVDFPAVAACAMGYHDAVVATLTPLDLRGGLKAAFVAGVGFDDEEADAAVEAALWRWAVGEGAVNDRTRAASREALGIVEEARAITRAARSTREARRAAARRSLAAWPVAASVHIPEHRR